jgi:hypothetical protein
VRNNPLFHSLLIGLVFTVVGGGFFLLAAHRTDLSCQRMPPNQTNCTIQASWLGFFPQTPRLAADVQTAEMAENCDSDGCTYRIELVTTQGRVPLTNVYSSGYEGQARFATTLNGYLAADSPESFELRTDFGMGWMVIVPVIFTLIGLAAIAGVIAQVIIRQFGWHTGF